MAKSGSVVPGCRAQSELRALVLERRSAVRQIVLKPPAPPVRRAPRGSASIALAFLGRDRAAAAFHRGGHDAAVLARTHSDAARADADRQVTVAIAMNVAVPIPVAGTELHVDLRGLNPLR